MEIITDWVHKREPYFRYLIRKLAAALEKMPCEFIAGMVFLVGFATGLAHGFNFTVATVTFFIVLSAIACLLAAWAFLFTHHGFLRQVWALCAIAGNLFFISFI